MLCCFLKPQRIIFPCLAALPRRSVGDDGVSVGAVSGRICAPSSTGDPADFSPQTASEAAATAPGELALLPASRSPSGGPPAGASSEGALRWASLPSGHGSRHNNGGSRGSDAASSAYSRPPRSAAGRADDHSAGGTERGGGHHHYGAADENITWVTLTVSDDGAGVPAGSQDMLFLPFSQVRRRPCELSICSKSTPGRFPALVFTRRLPSLAPPHRCCS